MKKNKFKKIIKFDENFSYVFANKFWNGIAGTLTVIVIPFWLDEIRQGYYYGFQSLLAIQVLFELGMNFSIFQYSGKIGSNLNFSKDTITGKEIFISKFSSLSLLAHRWFTKASILYFFTLLLVGYLLFNKNEINIDEWLTSWVALTTTTSFIVFLNWKVTILEANGYLKQSSKIKLISSIVGYSTMWSVALLSKNLLAIPILPIINLFFLIFWLNKFMFLKKNHIKSKIIDDEKYLVSWNKDIRPFQTRIAGSWISGYIVNNSITPFAFNNLGSVSAGKIGMAMNIFSSIAALGGTPINSNTPSLIKKVSLNKIKQAKLTYLNMRNQSIILTLLFCIGFIGLMSILNMFNLFDITRLPEYKFLVLFTFNAVFMVLLQGYAIYIRSHGQEPLLKMSIINAIVISIGLLITTKYFSLNETIIFYILANIIITIPWAKSIFNKFYYDSKNP